MHLQLWQTSLLCLQVPDIETGPLRPVQQPEQEGDGWLKARWRRHARNKRIHQELAHPEELFWDGIWIQPEEIIQEGILISPHMTEDHYTSEVLEVLDLLFAQMGPTEPVGCSRQGLLLSSR